MREYILHLSDGEAQAVNSAATKAGLGLEDFMREAVLARIEAGNKPSVNNYGPVSLQAPKPEPVEEAKDKKSR